ncbi:MAG: hypothetical protein ACPLPR_06180 [Bacillota bacterium]
MVLVIEPYPDARYCSEVCGSLCCKVADVWTLQGEELSYDFWSANYPRLGKSTCGCLADNGLCNIHDNRRPLVCRIFPYFQFEGAVLASLSCRYVRDVVLPSVDTHVSRDWLFKEILEYLEYECSKEQLLQIEQRLRECKGLFLLVRGNRK